MGYRLLAIVTLPIVACSTESSDVDSTHAVDGGSGGDIATAGTAGEAGASGAVGGGGGTSGIGGTGPAATGGSSAGGQGGTTGGGGAGGSGGSTGGGGAAASAGVGGGAGVAGGGGTGAVAGAGGTGGSSGFGGTASCGASSDISGIWIEEAQLTCGGGERVPEQPIYELFFNSGNLNVTWTPFETYVDYWGTYQDIPDGLRTGTLSLQVEDGNFIPDDIDPDGRYTVCGDTLILENMWLGTYQSVTAEPGCGHRFRR